HEVALPDGCTQRTEVAAGHARPARTHSRVIPTNDELERMGRLAIKKPMRWTTTSIRWRAGRPSTRLGIHAGGSGMPDPYNNRPHGSGSIVHSTVPNARAINAEQQRDSQQPTRRSASMSS